LVASGIDKCDDKNVTIEAAGSTGWFSSLSRVCLNGLGLDPEKERIDVAITVSLFFMWRPLVGKMISLALQAQSG
jgi:hypothetical protein